MSTASMFDSTVQTTLEWLHELNEEVGGDDLQRAYRVLRSVLVALRDRLSAEEASDLGAQLPMLVRGIYYEGWNPSKTPRRERKLHAFLDHVSENLAGSADGDPEQVTRAVFGLLYRHISEGEIDDVKANLPSDLQSLWPA